MEISEWGRPYFGCATCQKRAVLEIGLRGLLTTGHESFIQGFTYRLLSIPQDVDPRTRPGLAATGYMGFLLENGSYILLLSPREIYWVLGK